MRIAKALVVLVTSALLGTACTVSSRSLAPRSDGGFVQRTLIEPDAYEVSGLACTTRVGREVVDDTVTEVEEWVGSGLFTNRLPGNSPNYDLRFRAEFDDGSTIEEGLAGLAFPLAPGDSTELFFVIATATRALKTCEVFAFDSVLNHAS